MGLTKYKLGELIEQSTANNRDLVYGIEKIVGVSSEGVFTTPKGDPLDVDLKPYKIVKNGAFVYTPTRVNLGSIAYRTQGLCIVSHLYIVFYLTDKGKKVIDPIWLYMYLRRKEFGREIDFRLFGSARPEFSYRDMADISITLPDIEYQRRFVSVFNALNNNLSVYQSKIEELKTVCNGHIENLKRSYSLSSMFVFNVNTARMGDKFAIALCDGGEHLVSSIYAVFKSKSEEKLLPDYLFMFLNRPEFDRYVRFNSWGSAREVFTMDDMNEVSIPIPDISIQRQIVNIHKCYIERQRIANGLTEQIKAICPVLIKGSLETAN